MPRTSWCGAVSASRRTCCGWSREAICPRHSVRGRCGRWGGSRITRFDPGGAVERILPVPTAQVTKCAFGGPSLTTLYVTTAAIGHDPTIDPMAGHLFQVETGIRGLPANVFEG